MRSFIGTTLFVGLWITGCSASPAVPSNVREEDQSAAAHRSEAARHRAEAEEESRDTTGLAGSRADPAGDINTEDDVVAQQREAAIHERDAADLQRTMEADCLNVVAAQRTQCSVGNHRVVAVDDLANGVTLRFAPGGDELQTTLSRIHCTHAYSDYAGRETMATCVLAIRSLSIAGRDDHGSIVVTLTTSHHPSLAALQTRAHAMLAPAPAH